MDTEVAGLSVEDGYSPERLALLEEHVPNRTSWKVLSEMINALPGKTIHEKKMCAYARAAGFTRENAPAAIPSVDVPQSRPPEGEYAPIKWDGALEWARTNKLAITGNALLDIAAINAARTEKYLPPFRISDLHERFRIIRRPIRRAA